MLAARILGKALAGPKVAEPLFSSLGATSSKASQRAATPSWTSILDSYTSRSTSNASFALFNSRESDENAKQTPSQAAQRYLNTQFGTPASFPVFASQEDISVSSRRGLATVPTGGSSVVDADPAGGGGYMLLSMAHATVASLCFLLPEAVANVFFPGAALPQGMQTQVRKNIKFRSSIT